MNEIFEKINKLPGVTGQIILKDGKISLAEKSLMLFFVADFIVEDDLYYSIESLIKSEIPSSFNKIYLHFEKVVADKPLVFNEIKKIMEQSHKIIAEFIDYERSTFEKDGYNCKVTLYAEETSYDFIKNGNVDKELEKYLSDSFVENFSVTFLNAGIEDFDYVKFKPTEKDLYKREKRTFKVDEVTKLFDDDDERTCVYIADTRKYIGDAYVAGEIVKIEERETKTGKPYFMIEITDRTGRLFGTVFPTKANLPKVRKLAPGVGIIARGEFAQKGEYINFTYRSINLCVFPKNFVPQDREKRPCPQKYNIVFPKPLEIEAQDNFLEVKTVPECLIGRTFVVFDLETTGIDMDDKITEIGAVKIVDGQLTEYFSTLVNPGKHIPQEVIDLTGINDEMVKNAPSFADVCGDFYKFCDGATLVAHNIEFDSRFIKTQGEAVDYYFDNPLMDTLQLARETLPGMSNYKLNTLCDRFGIVFRHHRAYSDAWATSELFIEIIRIRNSLPF